MLKKLGTAGLMIAVTCLTIGCDQPATESPAVSSPSESKIRALESTRARRAN